MGALATADEGERIPIARPTPAARLHRDHRTHSPQKNRTPQRLLVERQPLDAVAPFAARSAAAALLRGEAEMSERIDPPSTQSSRDQPHPEEHAQGRTRCLRRSRSGGSTASIVERCWRVIFLRPRRSFSTTWGDAIRSASGLALPHSR